MEGQIYEAVFEVEVVSPVKVSALLRQFRPDAAIVLVDQQRTPGNGPLVLADSRARVLITRQSICRQTMPNTRRVAAVDQPRTQTAKNGRRLLTRSSEPDGNCNQAALRDTDQKEHEPQSVPGKSIELLAMFFPERG